MPITFLEYIEFNNNKIKYASSSIAARSTLHTSPYCSTGPSNRRGKCSQVVITPSYFYGRYKFAKKLQWSFYQPLWNKQTIFFPPDCTRRSKIYSKDSDLTLHHKSCLHDLPDDWLTHKVTQLWLREHECPGIPFFPTQKQIWKIDLFLNTITLLVLLIKLPLGTWKFSLAAGTNLFPE